MNFTAGDSTLNKAREYARQAELVHFHDLAMRCIAIALLLLNAPAYAALQLSASVNPQPARPGELLEVELTVTNTDAIARTGVILTMVYPAGLNAILPSHFGASCPPLLKAVSATALPPGGGRRLN